MLPNKKEDTVQNVEAIHKKTKISVVKTIVFQLERKMTENDKEIFDLKSRSMLGNPLIHKFKESPNQNLKLNVPSVIKNVYGVDRKPVHTQCVCLFRHGLVQSAIVWKLKHYEKKEEILQV